MGVMESLGALGGRQGVTVCPRVGTWNPLVPWDWCRGVLVCPRVVSRHPRVPLEGQRGRCVRQGGHRESPGALTWLSRDPFVAQDGHCGVPGYPARVLQEEGHHGFHGHPREVPQGLGRGGVQACPGKGFAGAHPPSVGCARPRKGLTGPWEGVPRVGWRGARV